MKDESILIIGWETGREFGEDTYGLTACKELLQDKGFSNVQVANNLELALNAIATYTPKVILLEYSASSKMLTEVASHKGTAHLLVFSKYNNYDIGMVYNRMPHVDRLIKFVEAGVIDYIDGIQDLNLDDMTRIPLPDALIKAIGQALTQESPLVLPPIISKVLYTFGRVELAHSELHKRAKLDVYEHYYMPGDLVYFKERRKMAFCSIKQIIRRKEDPRQIEFVLEILKQPDHHDYFRSLFTLRKY